MEKLVFTNGCFDILHPGHIDLLERARALGTRLVVGINSDSSVRAIKGEGRPFMGQDARAAVLRGLRCVDEVIVFEELTPENLIKDLKPDVLVKGGDWEPGAIIGADVVLANGGEVHSLPLLEGFSSSSVVDRVRGGGMTGGGSGGNARAGAAAEIDEHCAVFSELAGNAAAIERAGRTILETFESGGKVLICGNGGSAADAQHLAAEFSGRYERERRALPAIALTTDTSALTAIGNDYGFDSVFARQVEGLARAGDLLVAISTSGNSPNVIAAVMEARRRGCRTIGLAGAGGKKLASLCDEAVLVPSARTSRIQEAHIAVAHIWCGIVERGLTADGGKGASDR